MPMHLASGCAQRLSYGKGALLGNCQAVPPWRVRSSVKLSRFQSLTVLSEEAVASWRQSGLSRHLSTYLPASRRPLLGFMA